METPSLLLKILLASKTTLMLTKRTLLSSVFQLSMMLIPTTYPKNVSNSHTQLHLLKSSLYHPSTRLRCCAPKEYHMCRKNKDPHTHGRVGNPYTQLDPLKLSPTTQPRGQEGPRPKDTTRTGRLAILTRTRSAILSTHNG